MAKRNFHVFARRNWLILAVLLLALGVALFFASRFFLNFLTFNDLRNTDADLQPWMTPRFVVVSYDLPRELVFDVLELDPEEDRGLRLRRVAERQGVSMEELTERVREAAEDYRGQEP